MAEDAAAGDGAPPTGVGLFPVELQTDRLRLERLDRSNVDVLAFYRICSATGMSEVTRYMPWEPHATPNETREFLERTEERWTDGEAASYLLRPREGEAGAGEVAGVGTLHVDWDRRLGRLGTWLRRPFWGRGYSGERAGALLNLAFDRLDLEAVAVTHHVDNDNSRRAIEKYVDRFGGRREGRLRNWLSYPDEVTDEVRYTVTAEEYAAATEGRAGD